VGVAIHWFRNDLRLRDDTALAESARAARPWSTTLLRRELALERYRAAWEQAR